MDLKDVVETVSEKVAEAHSAFHAGHHDTAEGYLGEARLVIEAYFAQLASPAGDVTESNKGQAYSMADAGTTKETDITEKATSEKPAESLEETQAKVSGPGVHPAVIDPAAAARTIGSGPKDEKPTQ